MVMLAGNDAVRGTINDGMDVEFALRFGKVIGRIYGSPLAVSMDGRVSNLMLKNALTSGMMSVGCNVMDLGEAPTPVLQYYMAHHPDVRGGVTITASYAGQDQNGFKILKSGGMEDPFFAEHTLESIYEEDIPCVTGPEVGNVFMVEDVTEGYFDSIVSNVDAEAISKSGLRLCLDCRNGTVADMAWNLLRRLSVECVTLGGGYSSFGDERVKKLGGVVKSQGLDLGVAIDMDADRCLFTTSDGVPVPGDKGFAIIARALLSGKKGKVVMPANSTDLMEDIVTENGGLLMRCIVSEPMVAKKVMEYEAIFGGDVYGTFVLPDHMCSCDALMALVKMLECIVKDGPLSKQIEEFPTYHLSRCSIDIPNERIPGVLEKIRELNSDKIIDDTDGVKIITDEGWIMVRKSASDSLIKIYTQANDAETARRWVEETAGLIASFQEE